MTAEEMTLATEPTGLTLGELLAEFGFETTPGLLEEVPNEEPPDYSHEPSVLEKRIERLEDHAGLPTFEPAIEG